MPGQPVLGRRADELVPHQQVQALAAGLVERRLEVVPERLLPVRSDGRETLGGDEPASVGVRGRRGLLDEEPVVVADPVPPRPCPELRHGHVVETEAALRVDRHRVRPAGLRMDQQPVLVGSVAKRAIVVVDYQVAQRLAKIVEESVARVAALDDAAGQHRQPRQRIVPAALLETPHGVVGVQFSGSISQLSVCRYFSAVPASGPASAISGSTTASQ